MELLKESSAINLIDAVAKNLKDTSIFSIAERLQTFYCHKCYDFTECEKVLALYLQYFFMDLCFYLGKNKHKLMKGKEQLLKLDNFFKCAILEAKIDTFEYRRKLYFEWVGIGISNEEIGIYLKKVYSSINDREEVKRALGLNEPIDELRKKLKGLK